MKPVKLSRIKLGERLIKKPTIVGYNRLEGRPRTTDFSRALKAEIRDPLWMLSKQWQVGEFQGDDAASPVLAKLLYKTSRIDKYQGGPNGEIQPLPEERPLEMEVERQTVQMRQAGRKISLNLRLMLGRYWKKLLVKENLNHLLSEFQRIYAITEPNADDPNDFPRTAHPNVWRRFRAAAGKTIDGYSLLEYLQVDTNNSPADNIIGLQVDDDVKLDGLVDSLKNWWQKLLQQEGVPNDSWQPEYLEHQFRISAGDTKDDSRQVFEASEYYHGHLDWYNVDEVKNDTGAIGQETIDEAVKKTSLSFFPTNIQFAGMPHPRWWTLEDRQASLMAINPDKTDLNKLLVLDFQLQYANDWFMLPIGVEVGTVAAIDGLMITDSFNENTWVKVAGEGQDQDWERWSMFHPSIAGDGNEPASNDLIILPAVPKILEAAPREEAWLLRDEMSNMVWGLESLIALDDGQSRRGKETARELYNRYASQFTPAPDIPFAAPTRYQIVNSVPENWIPFQPVHIEGQNRQIQLQRAAMPRILSGDPSRPQKIEPRTSLLRTGLDQTPAQTYFINEAEVARAGTRIRLSFQRTRWYNGRIYTWLGFRKTTGRGEGSAGLKFDYLVSSEKKERNNE